MKTYLTIGALALAVATPALAYDMSGGSHVTSKVHWAVMDSVGMCSVIDQPPGESLKVMGKSDGYSSVSDAAKAFGSGCKGTIDRG